MSIKRWCSPCFRKQFKSSLRVICKITLRSTHKRAWQTHRVQYVRRETLIATRSALQVPENPLATSCVWHDLICLGKCWNTWNFHTFRRKSSSIHQICKIDAWCIFCHKLVVSLRCQYVVNSAGQRGTPLFKLLEPKFSDDIQSKKTNATVLYSICIYCVYTVYICIPSRSFTYTYQILHVFLLISYNIIHATHAKYYHKHNTYAQPLPGVYALHV